MQAEREIGIQKHYWTWDKYLKASELGWFDHKRVELIEGEVVYMSAMSVSHFQGVVRVDRILQQIFINDFFVSTQCPIQVSDVSAPEPDVAVIAGRFEDYKEELPQTAALVVEIADTSLSYDRTEKASLYAKADVPDYWIINLKDRRLEIRRQPLEDATASSGYLYANTQILTENDLVSPLAMPNVQIAVADLLP